MKKIIYILFVFFSVYPSFCMSQETNKFDKDLEDISGQYAECTAYYELVYHAMITSGQNETASAFKNLKDTSLFYSVLIADNGRSREMAIEVISSRIDTYLKKMKQEADNRNENISTLKNRYHYNCQDIMKNPPNKLVDYLSKENVKEENSPEN